jgi:hypothetical protein
MMDRVESKETVPEAREDIDAIMRLYSRLKELRPDNYRAAAVNFITDLMHWCEEMGINFLDVLHEALPLWEEERE